MKTFNIYLIGVGGQGIGLLSETLLRAADHAGLGIKAVDTHGLAQRGGVVVSNIRIGDRSFSPIIPEGAADLVVALERHEALRGINTALRNGGTLVYYDTVWQPLGVRLKQSPEVDGETLRRSCEARGIRVVRVVAPGLKDARMQNMAVLGAIHVHGLVPGISRENYREAIGDLLEGDILRQNLETFEGGAWESTM